MLQLNLMQGWARSLKPDVLTVIAKQQLHAVGAGKNDYSVRCDCSLGLKNHRRGELKLDTLWESVSSWLDVRFFFFSLSVFSLLNDAKFAGSIFRTAINRSKIYELQQMANSDLNARKKIQKYQLFSQSQDIKHEEHSVQCGTEK